MAGAGRGWCSAVSVFSMGTAAAALIVATAPAWAAGQGSGPNPDSVREIPAATIMARRWSVGGWAALGQHQMIKTRFGRMHDRDLYLVGMRAATPLTTGRRFTLDYTIDVVPLILATANREYAHETIECPVPGNPLCAVYYPQTILIPSRRTAYGFGVAPIGLRARYSLVGSLQGLAGLSGGMAAFDRRIPDPDERRLNFMAEGSIGVLLRTRLGGATGGIRWHHISNDNTGRVNPALDSQIWFFGFER